MPKVTQEYLDAKRKEIIDAAYRVSLCKTMCTITMQDVINESGLSQGGIYRYYKDVDEILADMICDIRSRICIIPKVDDILHSEESF